MLLGLRTVIYEVGDLGAATAWYRELLGFPPYFEEDFYVGFDVGGYELGLLPGDRPGSSAGQSYWGVESMEAAWRRVLSLGAEPSSPPTDVGGGIQVAVAVDGVGNLLGLIENPNFTARG